MLLSSFAIIITKHKYCQSRDHSIRRLRFTINGPSSPCVYLAPLVRYGEKGKGKKKGKEKRKG